MSVLIGDGTGAFSQAITYAAGNGTRGITSGDFNGDGVLDIATSNYLSSNSSVFLGSTTSGTAPLLDFSLDTLADARQALPVFRKKLQQLATQRGQIGVFESRLNTAKNVVEASIENFISAESQIRDADIAAEAASLTRESILQQAASAVLSQANQQPSLALQLLQ